MRKVFLHISVLAAMLFLCLACSQDKTSVIPRGKLAKIYAEMLLMDQWAQSESFLRNTADTSLVYEPIFQKYGYDTEDYIKSVDYYMNDPERFSRILRQTAEILDARIDELNALKNALKRQEEINTFVTDFNIAEFYPYLSEEPYVHYYDSLAVEADSFKVYRIVPIERADTLFDRLRMIVPADSVHVDSMKVDSMKVDSIAVEKVVEKVIEKEVVSSKPQDVVELNKRPASRSGMRNLLKHSKLDTLKVN